MIKRILITSLLLFGLGGYDKATAEPSESSKMVFEAMQQYCLGRNTAEIATGYRQLRPIVAGAASAIFRQSAADRNDLIQEAFVKIWRNCDRIRLAEQDKIKALIRTVTRNAGLDMLREKKRPAELTPEIQATLAGSEDLPEDIMHRAHVISIMEEYIRRQPKDIQLAFAMTEPDADAMTIRDAAKALGLNEQTLYTRLSKARREMTSLEAEGVDLGVPAPKDAMRVLDQGMRYREIALASGEPSDIRRLAQANGRALWTKDKVMPLQDFIAQNGSKLTIKSKGSYSGWSLSMSVPPGTIPPGTQLIVSDPFVVAPSDKLEAAHYQRLVISAVKALSDTEFELEAWCVDEHLSGPLEEMAYKSASDASQKVVTPSLRKALRQPFDEEYKSVCIWKAVAGDKLPPGVCK